MANVSGRMLVRGRLRDRLSDDYHVQIACVIWTPFDYCKVRMISSKATAPLVTCSSRKTNTEDAGSAIGL